MNENIKQNKLSIKEFLKIIWWTFKIHYSMSPFCTITLILTSPLIRIKGLILAFIMSKIFDTLITISQMSLPNYKLLLNYLLILFVFEFVFEVLVRNLYSKSTNIISLISKSEIDKLVYTHLNNLGVQKLEDPITNDLLIRSQIGIYNTFYILS